MRTSLLLGSALLAAPALLAQRFPEVEPNDTPALAQAVTMGTQIDANLLAGEDDWFSFSTTGGNVRIFTSGVGSGAVDTRIEIYDAAGTTLLAFNDDARSLLSDFAINLTAGTYMARIYGFGPTTTGVYYLDIGEGTPKPYSGVEIEPNDSLAQAQLLPLNVPGGVQLAAAIDTVGDQDWYQVVLTAPRTGIWFHVTEAGVPCISRSRYEVYDSAGVLVVAATLGANAANSSDYNFRHSQVRCWPAGTYYIVIRESTSTGTNPHPLPVGEYRLELFDMPMSIGATVPEAAEPNNSAATATPIAIGDQGTGNLSDSTGADASDWWGPIVLTQPTVLQYQTAQGNTATPILDTTIRLWDASNLVTAALTSTTGNILSPSSHARATVSFFLTPATYYIEVVSPLSTTSGDYILEIGANTAPYVTASYAFGNVNTTCLGSNTLRPTITTVSTRELPVLGTTFSRTIGSMQANATFILMQGYTTLTANGGVTPLPYDLGTLGAPNCFVNVDPVATTLFVADASGSLTIDSFTSGNIVFRGLPIFEQVLALDMTANALGVTASNYGRQILGERSY